MKPQPVIRHATGAALLLALPATHAHDIGIPHGVHLEGLGHLFPGLEYLAVLAVGAWGAWRWWRHGRR